MRALLTTFTEVFVPLFVALSPLTALPIFLSMTEGMAVDTARKLSHRAVLTGFVIASIIVLAGQAIFRVLGITVDDLRVAGGLVLLMISMYDLIFTRERRKESDIGTDAGIVPLGTPLIVGPATMTTCIVLADTHGRLWVLF
ncbi:MAG: MarC family protein, partial [Myxococcota bacterium]